MNANTVQVCQEANSPGPDKGRVLGGRDEGGPGPPDKEQDKHIEPQQGRRQHGAGGRREGETGVMKKTHHAQSEHY